MSGQGDGWETVSEIAMRHGMTSAEVEKLARFLGVSESKVNARDSARGREYSPGIVLLMERELRSRGREVARSQKVG